MSGIGHRIKELRESKGWTQAELGRRVGLKQQAIGYIESAEGRGSKHLVRFAEVLGVTAEYLQTGRVANSDHLAAYSGDLASGLVEVGGEDFVSVPRFDTALSAGDGAILDPNAEPLGFQLFERQWLRLIVDTAPAQLAVLRVDGDSMVDTLNDGDWVLIDRAQTRLGRQGIYALAIHDIAWVKRLSLNLRDGLVQVISDNPRYPVQELAEDELTLIGRVVSIVSRRL